MAIAQLFEAFAFTAVVLVDIWFLHSRTWWGDALPGVFALVSFGAHRESLGLGIRDLVAALRAWRVILLIAAAAVMVGLLLKTYPLELLFRGVVYFAWCVLQQLLLQNMIYRRIR